MAKLIFNRSIGKFVKGETYEVEGITADYFTNNNIAEEVVEKKEGCGCNDTVESTEEVVEKPKKSTNKK